MQAYGVEVAGVPKVPPTHIKHLSFQMSPFGGLV